MSKKNTKKTNKTKVDLTKVEEALENVNTDIKIEEEEIKLPESEKLNELVEIIDEINESEQNLLKNIEKEPEKAVSLIQNEIKKTEEIKKKVEKINKFHGYSTTWNGMYID